MGCNTIQVCGNEENESEQKIDSMNSNLLITCVYSRKHTRQNIPICIIT